MKSQPLKMVARAAGMTPEEVLEVKKAWKLVMDNLNFNAITFLTSYVLSLFCFIGLVFHSIINMDLIGSQPLP